MAVTPGYVTSVAITWAASATATASAASIGTATWDRLVVVGITVEETATINTVTIGGITATSGISVRNTTGTPDNACALFYARVPTGTTANIVVTLSASSSQTGRISIWAVTGAMTPHTTSNSAQGAGATQTLGGVTIPTNGAGFWVFNNATAGTAITWTNATERDDADNSGVTYRHGAADTTTAGTPTVTADGATANQILAGISFDQLPPGEGWDQTPQNSRMPFPRPRTAAVALAAASGLIWVPQPIVQLGTGPQSLPSKADIVTGRRGVRTLHYQSWVRPPAPPAAAVAPGVAWQQPLSTGAVGQPPYLAKAGYITTPPPMAAPENRGGTSVTTSYPSPRTGPLFYQSKIEPPPQPTAAAVVVATIEWVPPLSTMPPSRFVVRPFGQFTPPQIAAVTPDEWLTPFQRAAPGPRPVHTQPVFAYPPAAPPTADEWLTPFTRAVARPRVANALHTPFVPEEATIENTIPGGGWLQPFYKAASATKLNVTDVTYAEYAPVASNLTTSLEWQIAWQGPPRIWPLGKPYQPFVPREATRENTVTPDNWLEAFQGPPRVLLRLPGGLPFVPKEVPQDVHGPEKWLQAFRGPPRYWPVKVQTPPFVPKEATLENTLGNIAWLQPFYKAAPTPPAWRTQPFYGYPYEFASNLTTSIEWLQKWQGPPRYTPLKSYPYQPFVPKEATRENTVATGGWMRGFERQRPARPVARPHIAWSYEPVVADNTFRIDKWQQPLSRAVRIPRTARPTQPFYGYPYEGVSTVSRGGITVSTTYRLPRHPLFYQAWAVGYEPPHVPVAYTQQVTTGITVSFERVRRTVCRAQADDGSVTQAEQGDVWVTQDEAPGDCNSAFEFVAFQEDAFQSCEVISFEVTEQSDQWTTQAEADDPWSEQQQEPGSSCCDED